MHKQQPWQKKGDTTFDVTMGSYDGAETCKLVGSLRETNFASFPFNISILLPVRKMCTSRRCSYPEGKSIYSTYGDGILSSVERTEMRLLVPCTHEEADTRLTVHVLDATYVWGQTSFYQPVLPSPSDRGWWQLNNSWSPF